MPDRSARGHPDLDIYLTPRRLAADPAYWQGRTGAIEDTLSDALHKRLTLRFVDRRAAPIDRKREGRTIAIGVTARVMSS